MIFSRKIYTTHLVLKHEDEVVVSVAKMMEKSDETSTFFQRRDIQKTSSAIPCALRKIKT